MSTINSRFGDGQCLPVSELGGRTILWNTCNKHGTQSARLHCQPKIAKSLKSMGIHTAVPSVPSDVVTTSKRVDHWHDCKYTCHAIRTNSKNKENHQTGNQKSSRRRHALWLKTHNWQTIEHINMRKCRYMATIPGGEWSSLQWVCVQTNPDPVQWRSPGKVIIALRLFIKRRSIVKLCCFEL